MERLTASNNGVAWYKSDLLLLEPCELSYSQVGEVLRRLAAYEETGLTPEEIKELTLYAMGKALAEVKEFDGIPVDRLKELVRADKEGRLKIVKKPPEGACCGHCGDFNRERGTARGTCRTQHVKRNRSLRNEFRKVSQSTKACEAFTPIEETEAGL